MLARLALVLPILALSPAAAQTAGPPLDSGFSGPEGLGALDLKDALLIASGANSKPELTRARRQLDAALDRVAKQVTPIAGDDLARTEALLEALHAGPLKRYSANVDDLRFTLATGDFNCLTGTALFALAAREVGLVARAYAMHGHVMAIVYLTSGPHYVELTDPRARPSRDWTAPESVAAKSLRESADALRPKAAKVLKAAAAAQLVGADDAAEEALAALEAAYAAIAAKAKREEELVRTSAFEVNPPTLVSLFYWNRTGNAAFRGEMAAALRNLGIAVALGSATWNTQTLGVRVSFLEDLIHANAARKGWRSSIQALDMLLGANQDPQEHDLLRDIRARAYAVWASASPETKRCAVVDAARAADPEHPLVRWLIERSGCSAGP